MEELTYENIINKSVLVEAYNFTKDNEFVDRTQMVGKIIFAQSNGMAFKRDSDGRVMTLPGNLDNFEPGDPEGYELDETGEVIHPDLVVAFKIYVA